MILSFQIISLNSMAIFPIFQHIVPTWPRDIIEESIILHTVAIFLPPRWDTPCSNIAQSLSAIARLLLLRAALTKQPEDVKRSIIYLRYLRGQSPDAFNISRDETKQVLVCALGLQVLLELGDVAQDIEEMAGLFLEILNSDIWPTSMVGAITSFVEVVKLRFRKWGKGKGPPAKVIDCLRMVKIRLPDSGELSITLACTLLDRYYTARLKDDYEEGTAILDKFLTSHAPEDDPSQYLEALQFFSLFSQARLIKFSKPEYLEEAIYRFRNWLPWIPLEHPIRPSVTHHLACLQSTHFEDFGVGSFQGEHSCDSIFSSRPSFRDLAASLMTPSMETGAQLLHAPPSAFHMTDMAEIKAAIEYHRILLAPVYHHDLQESAAFYIVGALLLRAFQISDNIEYVNEAISVLRHGSNLPDAESSGLVLLLIHSLNTRFGLRRSREDLDELTQLYQMAVNDRSTKIPDRFHISCEWAQLARFHNHPSTSTAYECALSLMQDSITFAPTIDIQHSRLVGMRGNYETLPLYCASYQVHAGKPQSAIETLERGRALIWSEMRGLRSSIDQLRASDSEAANELAAINEDLEVLTLTLAQNNHGGGGGEEGLEGMDPFGRLVVRQRGLLDNRDRLISQTRARKGLESFLKPPSFDNLRSAAVRGPVIMINHCRWRSDIIILLHDSPPSLIPTANYFYYLANKLRDELLDARKKGLDSVEYDDALRSVLKGLYELVGRPVIQRLNELHVPEQSRVWWCPTSVFCFLPLHAMGPILSESGTPRYFLDLYIPSYTPTLSTLIESNKSGPQTLGKPSLLLVVRPDPPMEDALGEMHAVQSINTKVKKLISTKATPTAVLRRLQDHRFVHIICHGILKPGKPFDSSFELYRGNLTLLDIMGSQLPNAEFAFLAACHTAELTDGSLSDEALHLTAAMQHCGFRSVVGTMWAMADKDGRDLSKTFYESVFTQTESRGVRYHERTAEALRDAVIKLRKKRGRGITLERWVNFVHYGA
jgi:CHAT domain-containing protein